MSVWTKELADQVRHMREVEGLMFRQIAMRLGMTKNQVTAKYHRMTGQKPQNDRNRYRERRTKWDSNHGDWDVKTFLPYAEWKMWNRSQRKKREAEGIQDCARHDYTGGNQSDSSERSPGVRAV